MKLVNDCLNIIANTELTTSDSEMTMHIVSTCELTLSVHKWCSNTTPLLADPSHTSPHFRVKYKDFLVLAVSLTDKYRCMILFFLGKRMNRCPFLFTQERNVPPLHCLFLLKIFIGGVLITIDLHVGHVPLFRRDGLVNLHEALTVWVSAVPASQHHDAHHHGHH